MSKFIIVSILTNLMMIFFLKNLVKYYNVFDAADGIRKFQSKPVSLIGGFFLFLNLSIFFILDLFWENKIFEILFFSTNKELFIFYFGSLAFFLFGFIDDKFILQPNIKLIILILICFLIIRLDNNLLLKSLYFNSIDYEVNLHSYSTFFTILCILLFANSLNMFDGINLQVGSYSFLIFLIFFMKGILSDLSALLCISLIFFLYLNYKGLIFLGGSGVHLIAFLISYFFIRTYNINQNLISLEEIFIIMGIPGMELLRLFILRIKNKKHPFKADTNHLHHLLKKKLSATQTFLFIFIYIFLSIGLFYLVDFKLLYIIGYCIIYFLIIYYLTREKNI